MKILEEQGLPGLSLPPPALSELCFKAGGEGEPDYGGHEDVAPSAASGGAHEGHGQRAAEGGTGALGVGEAQ